MCLSQNYSLTDIEFRHNGDRLNYALSGGLNNPQFSEVDLNNDGLQDLFLFDRKGNVVLTFLNNGPNAENHYQYAPEYANNFPRVKEWALIRDYNCDNIGDLFAFSTIPGVFGVQVWKGSYNADNEISYEMLTFPANAFDNLYYLHPFTGLNTNIVVTGEDIPALDDLDNDGDLDVLTFNPGGGYIEYYENQSMDLGFGCDTLLFDLVDECWGRFYESGLTNSIDLSPMMDSCINRAEFIGKSGGVHVGSTVLTLDMDADNDKDLILGDITFPHLNMAINGGNADTSFLIQQDPTFPSENIPVDVNTFPGAFYLDVDNDGLKDLIAAPNAQNISENYFCSWFYKNEGANNQPSFDFVTNTFLVDEMIDFGSEANPVFFDHNSDGLLDIVVGSGGYFNPGGVFDARLFLFENVGTLSDPKYELADENYAGLMGLGLRSLHPAFADIDNDDDEDMLLGEEMGKLFYFENQDIGDGVAVFSSFVANFQGIDVGQFSTPVFEDMNRDNLIDLVIGEFNGNVNYYQNTGTQEVPVFTLFNSFFGEIDTREPGFSTGYSQPIVMEIGGEYQIFTGGEPGNLKRYTNVESNLFTGSFIEADSNHADLFVGERIRIDMADINDDGMVEIVIGNRRGGISIFSQSEINTVSINNVSLPENFISLYPNPTRGQIRLDFQNDLTESVKTKVLNALGQVIHSVELDADYSLDISYLPSGVYFISFFAENGFITKKFMKVE